MTPVHARICQRRRPQLPHRSAHIGIALAAVVVAATGVAGEPTPKPVEIVIVGAPDRGVFDPSIAGDGRQLYMTFSGVGSTGRLRDLNHNAVQTFLARSVDEGRTWRLVGGAVNPTVDAEMARRRRPPPWRSRRIVSTARATFSLSARCEAF